MKIAPELHYVARRGAALFQVEPSASLQFRCLFCSWLNILLMMPSLILGLQHLACAAAMNGVYVFVL